MPDHTQTERYDRLGTRVSALCAVHCLLTPVLFAMAPTLGHLLPGEETLHRSFSVVVALLGVLAVARGFRQHRKALVLFLTAAGIGTIAFTAWFGDLLPSHPWEIGVTLCGSALMIAAHRLNHTFCNACRTCVHD